MKYPQFKNKRMDDEKPLIKLDDLSPSNTNSESGKASRVLQTHQLSYNASGFAMPTAIIRKERKEKA